MNRAVQPITGEMLHRINGGHFISNDGFCRCRECKPSLAMPCRPALPMNRAVFHRLGLAVGIAIAGGSR